MIRSSSCSGFSALEGGSRFKATTFRIASVSGYGQQLIFF